MTTETKLGLLSAGITCALAGLVAGSVVVAHKSGGTISAAPTAAVSGPGWFGPKADKEGLTWTPKELVDYLNGKGMKLEMKQNGDLTARGGLHFDTVRCRLIEVGKPDVSEYQHLGRYEFDAVGVEWLQDVDKARAYASTTKEENCVGWGRFLLFPSQSALPKVKKALGL